MPMYIASNVRHAVAAAQVDRLMAQAPIEQFRVHVRLVLAFTAEHSP